MSKRQFTRRIPNTRSTVRPPETLDAEKSYALEIATALGSETRWRIVCALAEETMNIQQLTETVGLSKGTVSVHIKQLEEAGVVGSRFNVSDSGGVEKEVALLVDEVNLKLSNR